MSDAFNFLKRIKKELIGFDCRVSAHLLLDDILEIEVYFPSLNFRVTDVFSGEELRVMVGEEILVASLVKKAHRVIAGDDR